MSRRRQKLSIAAPETEPDPGSAPTPAQGSADPKAADNVRAARQRRPSPATASAAGLPGHGPGAGLAAHAVAADHHNAASHEPLLNEATPSTDELLLVGRVVAAQGLGGELRVQPLSDFPERFTSPGRRWLRRPGEPARCWQLLSGRQLPGRQLFVLRLAALDNRTAAEALVGSDLLVAATDRPALAAGEFHLLDLVGLEVRLLPEGRPIGRVEDLLHAGQDLLEISLWPEEPASQEPAGQGRGASGPGQGIRRLIPFVEAIVPEVHLAEGWLGLTPPPGLLELKSPGESGSTPARPSVGPALAAEAIAPKGG